MQDKIMFFSSILFGVLFSFLLFVFCVFALSRFIKPKKSDFEPEVSVVIPAYNEGTRIKECLDSVFNSDYPIRKLEVIVVDDGSTDNTLETIKRRKNVRILRQSHLGKVEALNLGVSKASHDFIMSLDADTIVDPQCIKELLKPFSDISVGATTGNNIVKNNKTLISAFQNVEYHHLNLIRNSFSAVFNNGIWFSGSLACYRKEALEKIGNFKKDTLAEDQDVALELKKSGYRTINSSTALGYTVVPSKIRDLYRQRARWWMGTLQSVIKNRAILLKKASPSVIFLYVSQFWWSLYSFLSLPIILYQLNYWFPYNSHSTYSIFSYFIKWFSMIGPIYVIYRIPAFGISSYSIFGVLSGIITTVISLVALKSFKDKISIKNMLAIFFYFPYTILLNIIILLSILKHRFWEKGSYIK